MFNKNNVLVFNTHNVLCLNADRVLVLNKSNVLLLNEGDVFVSNKSHVLFSTGTMSCFFNENNGLVLNGSSCPVFEPEQRIAFQHTNVLL